MTTTSASRKLAADEGFTLVEMLVALSLLGLLAVALASTTGLGLRAWSGTAEITEQVDRTRAAQQVLRRTLSALYPEWTADRPAYVDFFGASDEMKFLAPAPAALGIPGLSRFQLRVERSEGQASLIVAVTPDRSPQGRDSPAKETVLVSGAREIEFSYFGTGETTQTRSWQTRWQRRPEPPRLIRIDVEAGPDGKPIWPSFVVNPLIDVDVTCDFDPLTHKCRGR